VAKKPAVRTITVALSNFIDNFNILGQGFKLTPKIRLQFHNDPIASLLGDRIETNFDIMIDAGYNTEFKNMLPSHRYIELKRYGKQEQACKLLHSATCYNNAIVEAWRKDHGFIPVPTWFVGNGKWDSNIAIPEGTKRVVIKPADGARGIGQFLVDVENVSLRSFFSEMKKTMIIPNVHDKETLDKFIATFGGYVTYHSRNENHEGEGIASMFSQGAVVQSVIPNVEHEFRLITNSRGLVDYVQKRNIVNVEHGFPQAVGSGTVNVASEKSLDIGDILNEPAVAMLDSITSTAIGPLNSIDLFLTDDGEWGIFEYCNQFGITGVPDSECIRLHSEFLVGHIDEYLKMEAFLNK
jgi:hypothetical protein